MSEDRTYAKIFHVSDSDLWVAEKIRAFAKWWLDLVRNIVVVAVLLYVSRKANSWPITIIAYASFGALVGYCLTYSSWWFWSPLHKYEGKMPFRLIYGALAAALAYGMFWTIAVGLHVTIDQLASAQAR